MCGKTRKSATASFQMKWFTMVWWTTRRNQRSGRKCLKNYDCCCCFFFWLFFVGRRCKSFLAAVRLKCIYTHRLYKVSMFWCWARSFRIGRNIFVDVLVCMRVYALSFREKKLFYRRLVKLLSICPKWIFSLAKNKTGFMITNGPICFL